MFTSSISHRKSKAAGRALQATLLCAGLAAACLATSQVHADEDAQKRAEQALRDDKALPLAEILKRVSPVLDGKVIGIEFEEDDDRFVYEFKVLSAKGKIREMVIDARSGEILKEEDD
ncbi:Uncharacterized membrane protein YkoI [Pannonibacter indicus]|uniref:Uncharacterized membrane protein YkoI n=1 Tax=Pannonibacter indicus TaxID=466044 RepID=A0A0K6I3K1_9HYPH|nr:Uncharacterized membrane protein YkoI [Pannonibacter indicus]